MSLDARYQAIPYEPLLERAMRDREAAEDAVQFFGSLATEDVAKSPYWDDPIWLELAPVARQVVSEHPGILERTFSTRAWDAVYWLHVPAGTDYPPVALPVWGSGSVVVELVSRSAAVARSAADSGARIRAIRPECPESATARRCDHGQVVPLD